MGGKNSTEKQEKRIQKQRQKEIKKREKELKKQRKTDAKEEAQENVYVQDQVPSPLPLKNDDPKIDTRNGNHPNDLPMDTPMRKQKEVNDKLSRDIFGTDAENLDEDMKEMLDQFKRPLLPGKVFGLYNKQEKDETGKLISQNNCFLNVVLQLFWNIKKLRAFMLEFADMENTKDNELIKSLKLFIKQADSIDEGEYMNNDNPIDFDVLNIRLALDRCYGDTNQFAVNQKCDAPETFEAITYQINANLTQADPKMAKKFRRLVNIGAGGIDRESVDGISANYISAEELIDVAPSDTKKVKFKLGKYLTKYFKNQQEENKSDNDSDASSSGDSRPTTSDDTIRPPKLHMLNISWLTTSSDKIYKLMCMIPNKIKFSKLNDSYNGTKDYSYFFKGLVCFWGSHYFLYMRNEDQWIQINDTYIKVEPSWTAIVEDFMRGKILPIMLCFERCDTKEEKRVAKQPLVLEDDYVEQISRSDSTQRIHDEEAWICDTCDEVNNGLLTQCSKCTVLKPPNARKANYDFSSTANAVHEATENEWVCDKCTTINPNTHFTCGVCRNKNYVIRHLIMQQRIANAGYNKYCYVCKDFYRGYDCPQCQENALIYNGVYNPGSRNAYGHY